MKKILSLITIMAMMLCLFACETEQSGSADGTEQSTTTTVQDQKSGTTSTTVNGGSQSTTSTTTTTIRYNVAFDANGGTGTMDRLSLSNDEIAQLPVCSYTKIGYNFIEWNNKKDGTGTIYDNEATVQNLTSSLGATVKLYAQWEAISYKVQFNANGGSGTMADQDFVYDTEQVFSANKFTAPTGKKFSSWNTTADGTETIYNDGQNVKNLTTVSNDTVTLYAQWIDKSAHSIHYYNTKDVTIPTDKQSFLESQRVELSNISAVGWIFDGWYNQEVGGSKVEGWEAGEKTGDVDLYGRWSADMVRYTVKTYFQTIDGLGYEQNLSEYPDDEKSGLTESTTTAEANDDITGFELQQIQQQTIAADGSTVVNIYYNRKSATYTFQPNGGNWNGNTNNITLNGLYGAEVSETPNNPTKAGYIFSNWSSDIPSIFGADNTVFMAQWSVGTASYTVKTYLQNVSGNGYKQDLSQYPNQTKSGTTETTTNVSAEDNVTGFDLQPIEQQTIKGNGTTVVNVYYNRKTITYTFDANGEIWSDGTTVNKTVSGLYGAAVNQPTPIKTGWTSIWDDSVPSVFGTVSKTFTAQWTANTYTIVFDANGGTGSMSNQVMTYDESANLRTITFTLTNRDFVGWSMDGSRSVAYTDGQIVSNLTATSGAIVTLYALWSTKVGDIAYSDGTFSDVRDGTKTPIGIVCQTNGVHGRIVHLKQAKSLMWCSPTAEGYNIKFNTNYSDGSINCQNIRDAVSDENVTGNYPALEYVNSLGEGWYLPARDEMNTIRINQSTIERGYKKLYIGTYDIIGYGSSDVYWTSTSYFEKSMYVEHFGQTNHSYESSKVSKILVRAVRAF